MTDVLQPTLWRTCRVIANPARLEIFAFLLKNPDQPVTSIAEHFKISLPSASEHLRLLESRGLLSVQRARKWVKYRVVPSDRKNPGSALAIAMKAVFQRDRRAAQSIFESATAFTHPRRVEVFRLLRDGPKSFDELRHASRISLWALHRHLKKLEVRGFVRLQKRLYVTTEPTDAMQRELGRLAAMAE